MDVIITEWGFQSYIQLKASRVFTSADYKTVLRPDVNRLKSGYPSSDPKFGLSSFWGLAKDLGGTTLPGGFKMKWHHLGSGRVQLRLLVYIGSGGAYLCQAYVKSNVSVDKRKIAKFKDHINLIGLKLHQERGRL